MLMLPTVISTDDATQRRPLDHEGTEREGEEGTALDSLLHLRLFAR